MLGFAQQEGQRRVRAYLVGVGRWRRAAALQIVAARKKVRGRDREVKGERGGTHTHRSDALGPSDWMASRLIFASIIAVRGR